MEDRFISTASNRSMVSKFGAGSSRVSSNNNISIEVEVVVVPVVVVVVVEVVESVGIIILV